MYRQNIYSTGIICKDSVLDGGFVVDDHEVGDGASPVPAAGPGMSLAAVPGPGPAAGSDQGFGVDAVAGPG